MKEPTHLPSLAFEKAREEREAWRLQQISELTSEQRQERQLVLAELRKELDARIAELKKGEREKLITKMIDRLSDEPKPRHHLPGAPGEKNQRDLRIMRAIVPDFVDGKSSPEIRRYLGPLTIARAEAVEEMRQERSEALRPLKEAHRRRQDEHFNKWQEERRTQKREVAQREVGENKEDVTQRNSPASDQKKSWEEAIVRAARQEAQRVKDDLDLTDTFNRRR